MGLTGAIMAWALILQTEPMVALPGFTDEKMCELAFKQLIWGTKEPPEHMCIEFDASEMVTPGDDADEQHELEKPLFKTPPSQRMPLPDLCPDCEDRMPDTQMAPERRPRPGSPYEKHGTNPTPDENGQWDDKPDEHNLPEGLGRDPTITIPRW